MADPTSQPPPLPVPPPSPREGRRGRRSVFSVARALFVTFVTTLFGFSLLLNVWLLASRGLLASPDGRIERLVEGPRTSRVMVLPVTGLITGSTAERFSRLADRVQREPTVRAIVLEIDTPGGEVTASDSIHQRVRRLKAEKGVPIYVSMGSLATSGGYYIACAADHVFAQRTTLTGNIGVLLPRYNLSGLAERLGVQDATIVSTGTPFKSAGSLLEPEREQDRVYLQGLIDSAFGTFRDVVSEGRAGRLTVPIEQVADGRAFGAAEARRVGLIDDVGYLTDAAVAAAGAAGLSRGEFAVDRFAPLPGLLGLLGMGDMGVRADPDPRTLARMLAVPRPMYLARW